MKFRSFAVAALLAIGCTSDKSFDQAIEFKDRTWKVSEPVELEFTIENVNDPYDISCTVRNSLDYPYARIFINYTLTDSIGQELSKKLVSHFLFDQKTGEPQGNSGLGDLYDHSFPLLKGYEFRYPGKFKMRLEQMMRQDTLKGVLAVGLQVQPTPPPSGK